MACLECGKKKFCSYSYTIPVKFSAFSFPQSRSVLSQCQFTCEPHLWKLLLRTCSLLSSCFHLVDSTIWFARVCNSKSLMRFQRAIAHISAEWLHHCRRESCEVGTRDTFAGAHPLHLGGPSVRLSTLSSF